MTAEDNVRVVQGFFQSFQEEVTNPGAIFSYIDNNFDPEVEYTVVGTESKLFGAEREAVLPHGGLYEGIAGVKYFFELTETERQVLDFTVHEVIGMGDSVAAFGSFRFRSPDTGDELETEWATRIEMRNGKIYRYQFYEDSYAVSAGYRQKDEPVSWSREFDGKQRNITTGTNGDDRFFGTQDIDLLFGYRAQDWLYGFAGDDSLYGGDGSDLIVGGTGTRSAVGNTLDRDYLEGGKGNDALFGNEGGDLLFGGDGNDSLYGGKDNDTVRGGNGNDLLSGDLGRDLLSGGAGSDRFIIRPNSGTDRITDFQDTQDRLVLVGGLTFADLTITQGTNETIISRTGGGTLVNLTGVSATQITSADFIV